MPDCHESIANTGTRGLCLTSNARVDDSHMLSSNACSVRGFSTGAPFCLRCSVRIWEENHLLVYSSFLSLILLPSTPSEGNFSIPYFPSQRLILKYSFRNDYFYFYFDKFIDKTLFQTSRNPQIGLNMYF